MKRLMTSSHSAHFYLCKELSHIPQWTPFLPEQALPNKANQESRAMRPGQEWDWLWNLGLMLYSIWDFQGSAWQNVVVVECFKSCPTLFRPQDCSPPGSSVHGIFQARILEWVAVSFSRGSSPLRDRTASPALAGGFFITEPPGKPAWQNTWFKMT